jgi:hypothetical protein
MRITNGSNQIFIRSGVRTVLDPFVVTNLTDSPCLVYVDVKDGVLHETTAAFLPVLKILGPKEASPIYPTLIRVSPTVNVMALEHLELEITRFETVCESEEHVCECATRKRAPRTPKTDKEVEQPVQDENETSNVPDEDIVREEVTPEEE